MYVDEGLPVQQKPIYRPPRVFSIHFDSNIVGVGDLYILPSNATWYQLSSSIDLAFVGNLERGNLLGFLNKVIRLQWLCNRFLLRLKPRIRFDSYWNNSMDSGTTVAQIWMPANGHIIEWQTSRLSNQGNDASMTIPLVSTKIETINAK